MCLPSKCLLHSLLHPSKVNPFSYLHQPSGILGWTLPLLPFLLHHFIPFCHLFLALLNAVSFNFHILHFGWNYPILLVAVVFTARVETTFVSSTSERERRRCWSGNIYFDICWQINLWATSSRLLATREKIIRFILLFSLSLKREESAWFGAAFEAYFYWCTCVIAMEGREGGKKFFEEVWDVFTYDVWKYGKKIPSSFISRELWELNLAS